MFARANVIANRIGWIVVAPVLDILIYAEPAKKVFAQGVFAGISNSITAVVVGGLLVLAYTKTIAKKGSLDNESLPSQSRPVACGLRKGFFG